LRLQTLTPPGTEPHACSQLYECGAANWYEQLEPKGLPLAASRPAPAPIPFRQDQATRRRGLQHVAPSHREGGGHIRLDRLFQPGEAAGMAAGTLFHAWFETIEWLDNGAPTEAVLRDAALAKRWELPADTWRDLDRLLAEFRQWLRNPDIEGILRRSAYADPKHVAFPQKLAHLFTKTLVPQRIERERRFLVRDGETFLSGSVDRIVWLSDEGRIIAADLIDFKTDKVEPGNESAFAERTEFYRPQLDAYRRAVSRLADLPAEHVAARLVFTFAGRVVEI
jgi:ATP-dependent helicase/nuclease subunit A